MARPVTVPNAFGLHCVANHFSPKTAKRPPIGGGAGIPRPGEVSLVGSSAPAPGKRSGHWVIDDTVTPVLSRAARDWHRDYFAELLANSMTCVAAFSQELVLPPDNPPSAVWVQRYPDGQPSKPPPASATRTPPTALSRRPSATTSRRPTKRWPATWRPPDSPPVSSSVRSSGGTSPTAPAGPSTTPKRPAASKPSIAARFTRSSHRTTIPPSAGCVDAMRRRQRPGRRCRLPNRVPADNAISTPLHRAPL